MGASSKVLMIIVTTALVLFWVAKSCSNGESKDCGTGLYYFSCPGSAIEDQFKLLNNSLPFNKYAFLTTHNAYAIESPPYKSGVPRLTFANQEDSITNQLNNGARALMLDTYEFQGDVWLCHSFNGRCHNFTAFGPAVDTLKEIEAFMAAKPAEIVTLILEDYVHAPNGLTKVFTDAGLMKYWFPLANMPKNGGDWPLVSDMVKNNQRLLVFTSIESKEESEGIAYQWNYMVENKYGDGGMLARRCPNRAESAAMNDKTKSLVLVNYFPSLPVKLYSRVDNAVDLTIMLHTCYVDSGNRWANFVAIDYYRKGTFQAVDTPNGKLLCGCDDVRACMGSYITYEKYKIAYLIITTSLMVIFMLMIIFQHPAYIYFLWIPQLYFSDIWIYFMPIDIV